MTTMSITMSNKRKYVVDVSVVSSLSGRGLHHVKGFEFESHEQEHNAIDKDGKQQFLAKFKARLPSEPAIEARINGTRYKVRTMRLRTA